jgi:hypothetical protein
MVVRISRPSRYNYKHGQDAAERDRMSGQKWGESFLKSGLPLEHLTLLALKSIGWTCELHSEYLRVNREGQLKWFEHDVIVFSPEGDLELLIECKYHDENRFWFFLPCETERSPRAIRGSFGGREPVRGFCGNSLCAS